MTAKMRVLCKSAPVGRERYQGVCGVLKVGPLPEAQRLFHTDAVHGPDAEPFPVSNEWVFEPTGADWPPENTTKPSAAERRMGPEERRGYDEKQFESDLDEAIDQARSILSVFPPEPKLGFKRGETVESALNQVMLILTLRMLPENTWSSPRAGVWGAARRMLIEKNAAYGDSALNPVRIFATASPMEQLLVRLDDKVSRLERGQAAGEDVANDLLGYLILVLIAKIRERRQ